MDRKLIEILVRAKDEASRTLKGVGGDLRHVGDESESTSNKFAALSSMVKTGAVALALAVGTAGTAAVKASADLEQNLNVLAQVSGATNGQMKEMSRLSNDLGSDLTLPGVSAADAASAMTELAKAGLSVNDTMAASRGVLALAKAGQLDTAQAAEITSNALLAFRLEGKEASRVADLLAAAANASSSDVHGMGLSLSQVSALAAQTKRPIEDVVAQIGLLANAGIKGSDAGTSLKTMLLMLSNPTKEAAELMAGLNIQIYDQSGAMRATRDIIGQFNGALSKMTDQQKDTTLATIFGSDAVRAASILVNGGTEAYDKMTKAVTKTGAAQELAAAYSKGFKGSLDGLKSTVETIGTEIGARFLPGLTDATNALSGWLGGFADKMRKGREEAEKALNPIARSIDVVTLATQAQTRADQELAAAKNNLTIAEDNLKNKNAELAAKHQEVTAAEQQLATATQQYGANSVEATNAAEQLRQKQAELETAMKNQFAAVSDVSAAKDTLAAKNDVLTEKTKQLNEWQTYLRDNNALLADSFGILGDRILQPTKKLEDLQRALDITTSKSFNFMGVVGDLQNRVENAARVQGQFQGQLQAPGSAVPRVNGPVQARASGGPVKAGELYRVNETGHEYFMPNQDGMILDANKTRQMAERGKVVNVYQTNHNYTQYDQDAAAAELGWRIANA
jgi:TP901 family phage tail tape measure protein